MVANEPDGEAPTPGNDERRRQPPRADPLSEDLVGVESISDNLEDDHTGYETTNDHIPRFDLGDEIQGRPLRRTSNIFTDTPRRRTFDRMAREARAQSIGGRWHEDEDPLQPSARIEELDDESTGELEEENGLPIIDGHRLTLASTPREARGGSTSLWDKTQRHLLPPEGRLAYDRQATSLCLQKNNKLSLPKYDAKGSSALYSIDNLTAQLKSLRFTMKFFDIYDVMNIVVPVDVTNTMMLEKKSYDLIDDYHQLHPAVVANSCTWYNRWVSSFYIRENMVLTFMLLQNNTEHDLWTTCMELYEVYTPIQQGGPLMLCLILRRIQNHSEKALDLLKEQVADISLHKITGEDVEEAVRLIKSTYRALTNASTHNRSYVPLDFTKTIFRVLQTSSVPDFNEVFATQVRAIQTKADMMGTSPVWPKPSVVLTLATNTYKRLKHTGEWDGLVKKSQAHLRAPIPNPGSHNANNPQAGTDASSTDISCWNCGGAHHLNDCPKPRDQAKIDAARQRFRALRRSRGKPKHKTGPDGKPLVLNKNGYYVLDQRKWREMQPQPAQESTSSNTSSPTANVAVADRADAVRAALQRGARS